MLVLDGCQVRLAVNGTVAGQTIPQYVRDQWLGVLHKLGVETVTHTRLFGANGDSVFMQHTLSGEAVVFEGVDTLVTVLGSQPVTSLEDALIDWDGDVHVIGDSLCPRTVEEAALEGLKVGAMI